jgi:hypothetical protein
MQLGIELIRINGKVLRFVIIKVDAIHAYLCCRMFVMQQQLMGTAPLTKELSGNSSPLILHVALLNLLCA